MKITKKTIQKQGDGRIGTIIEKRFGQPNNLNHCEKKGAYIEVEALEDQAPTIFTIDEFVTAYQGQNLTIL